MLHLLEKNHHHKGYVTYFGKEFADHSSVSTRDETIYHIEQLQSASRLLPLLETLDNMSPMILDRNSDAIRNDLWLRKPGEVDFLFPDIQASPTGNIDSYFEIVTETWFTDDTVSYITEKTIRPIVRLQPFIHIGTPFLLANLQAKGFKTFSPYINEEYDAIIDPTKRLEAIFTEIDRLCSLTLEEIHKIYTALWPTLIFNFNHYFDNARKYARKDIGHNILKKFERNYNKIHN